MRQEKIELLVLCGDVQCVRCQEDLNSMAVPKKYQMMNTFHEYVVGIKKAPVMTIFIGGNHEASNFLQDLPFGGRLCAVHCLLLSVFMFCCYP